MEKREEESLSTRLWDCRRQAFKERRLRIKIKKALAFLCYLPAKGRVPLDKEPHQSGLGAVEPTF
jgi:hypothetical protein